MPDVITWLKTFQKNCPLIWFSEIVQSLLPLSNQIPILTLDKSVIPEFRFPIGTYNTYIRTVKWIFPFSNFLIMSCINEHAKHPYTSKILNAFRSSPSIVDKLSSKCQYLHEASKNTTCFCKVYVRNMHAMAHFVKKCHPGKCHSAFQPITKHKLGYILHKSESGTKYKIGN